MYFRLTGDCLAFLVRFNFISSVLNDLSKVQQFANMPQHYRNSRAIWDHSVTCHPAKVTLPPLPKLIKAGTQFSDPRGIHARLNYLDGLVTYRGGIVARRRSPMSVLTGLNVE